jgi:hypothetical protein
MAIFKKDLFDEIQSLCDMDDHEQIFKYIFDYLSVSDCAALVQHIKEEKGLITNNDNEDE